MGKESVEHIHNGVLFSHKENEIVLCGRKWIELEIIMLSEIYQTQKIIEYFLSCIPLKLKKNQTGKKKMEYLTRKQSNDTEEKAEGDKG